MTKKEKFIQEVYSAIWSEIQEYEFAHNSTEGVLEYLQGYSWKIDKELCNKYFGQSTHYFDVFDTQEHLNEFIKAMKSN